MSTYAMSTCLLRCTVRESLLGASDSLDIYHTLSICCDTEFHKAIFVILIGNLARYHSQQSYEKKNNHETMWAKPKAKLTNIYIQ